MSNKSDSESATYRSQPESPTAVDNGGQNNGALREGELSADYSGIGIDDKELTQALDILGMNTSARPSITHVSPPASRRASLLSKSRPTSPRESQRSEGKPSSPLESQQSSDPPASPRGSLRANGQPPSLRGSKQSSSPPASPGGSLRGGNSNKSGSTVNSLRTRSRSRPSLIGFFPSVPTTDTLSKEDLAREKQKKIEEIKQAVYKRKKERQIAEEKKTTQPPRHVELLLNGIEGNTAGKNPQILTDDSISAVFSTLDQLTPIDKPEYGVLTRLDLQRNKIGGRGANQLCEYLLTRPSLEILDVSNNEHLFSEIPQTRQNIRDSTGLIGAQGYLGANAFKELLTHHPGLAYLMINQCGLTDFGANIIANGFKESSLVFLELSNNEITDTGAIAICRALTSHKTITTILLDGNNLTDTCSSQLLSLVELTTQITTLEINDTKISKPQMDKIKAQVKKNGEEYERAKAAQQKEESPGQNGQLKGDNSLGQTVESTMKV